MQVFNAMCTHMCVPFRHLNSVVASSIIGGGGGLIFIYSCSVLLISLEIHCFYGL